MNALAGRLNYARKPIAANQTWFSQAAASEYEVTETLVADWPQSANAIKTSAAGRVLRLEFGLELARFILTSLDWMR